MSKTHFIRQSNCLSILDMPHNIIDKYLNAEYEYTHISLHSSNLTAQQSSTRIVVSLFVMFTSFKTSRPIALIHLLSMGKI